MDIDVSGVEQEVSTGSMPRWEHIERLAQDAYQRYRDYDAGSVANYIPVLAQVDPELFGLSIVDSRGELHAVGDAQVEFSVQSISKAFVYALVCEAFGHQEVLARVGVNNTGLAFNSVMAIELNDGHPMNPMVNAGAIATTAMIPGTTAEEKWDNIHTGLSRFAGRRLDVDEVVYRSESETNKALARLLQSYGRIVMDPLVAVDIYTRQCALRVTARDLAVMGATLADGGVNPITGERVVGTEVCRDTLAVLASSGMYERSGEWLFEIGLPAKSGVSGGIVAIAPGKGALGSFSPRLDAAGNSVRGQRATAHLSRALGLNVFASAVQVPIRQESA